MMKLVVNNMSVINIKVTIHDKATLTYTKLILHFRCNLQNTLDLFELAHCFLEVMRFPCLALV